MSDNVTAEAPVSEAKPLRFSIPLELAIFTRCPAFEYCRTKVAPICPAPIIPIFNLFNWFCLSLKSSEIPPQSFLFNSAVQQSLTCFLQYIFLLSVYT